MNINPGPFQVVYDVTKDGAWALWFVAPGIGFMLIGLTQLRLAKKGVLRSCRNWSRYLFVGFAILWTLMTSISIGGAYLSDCSALRSGKAAYVEGPVENFVPMPSTGHAMERFDVKGVAFSYSDYVITPGFNRTSSHGGPIRGGLYVRIWYLKNDILKLEVLKILR
jgi:hypothetical protein